MFLKLQGYDVNLLYRPGRQMTLSVALCRLPNPENTKMVNLDTRVDGLDLDDIECKPIRMLNFSTDRLSKLRQDTYREPTLRVLKQCHTDIRPFFNFRECLAVEDGLIFKGPQVIVQYPTERVSFNNSMHHTKVLRRHELLPVIVPTGWPSANKLKP